MTESKRKTNPLHGKRFVVWGESPRGHAFFNALALVFGKENLEYVADRTEAEEELWMAGDLPEQSFLTHLIYCPARELRPDHMFKTHCALRPGARRTATLAGNGPGWSGGILFMGVFSNCIEELRTIEPFNKIGGGHQVLKASCKFTDSLSAIANLSPVFPNAWIKTLTALEGLAAIKSVLKNMEASARWLQSLQSAVEEILTDKLLDKLLEHREVIGRLREARDEIKSAMQMNNLAASQKLGLQVFRILSNYI